MAPDPAFTCHFLEVQGRLVHYACGGTGPAAAMLHGSPQSFRALLPLARRLASDFTVFAFDTPGYGASEPLPNGSGISAFGDALAAALQALGLGPVPVYGTHTGASIALEAANRHPDIVSRAVLDGFALFTPAERDDLLSRHLPPLQTLWDGSHMAALWARVRDQGVFFPWYCHADAARHSGNPGTPATQHQAVLDLLHAGTSYASAYGASIAHDHAALCVAPDRIRLFCRTTDVLIAHLQRLPPGFPPGNARAIGPWDDEAIVAALAEAPSCTAPPPQEPTRRRYSGGLHVRTLGRGPRLVLLHDLPGSSRTALTLAEALAATHEVVVPDLPGCGLSPPMNRQDEPERVASLVAAAVRQAGAVVGVGVGALLAPAVARQLQASRVALVDPPEGVLADAYSVDVTPRWDGSHLLAAWFRQQDALLFRPWSDRSAASAIPFDTPDLAALQDRVTAMLEAQGPDLAPALLRLRPATAHGLTAGDVAGIAAWLQSPSTRRTAAPCA